MQALVTGGAGFIGSNLTDALLARGIAVRVIDDLSAGHLSNLAGADVEIIEADIRDPAACERACAGVDVVFHQAARNSVPRSLADPMGAFEVNLVGTHNLLMAARDAGVGRFVYASSSSVYGANPALPRREDQLLAPMSPYAGSKAAMEDLCNGFGTAFGLPVIGLRYFNIFGPRQDPLNPYAAVVPLFIHAAIEGRAARIFGDGTQTRDFTFVTNAVAANIGAMDAPDSACQRAFNVATGGSVTVLELHRAIADAVGTYVPPQLVAPRAGDQPHSSADTAAAGAALGYRCDTSFEDGIAKTVAWFREHLHWFDPERRGV